MPSTCSICQESFPVWMAYHMHMEMRHSTKPAASVKRNLVGVKQPLSAEKREAAIARGEKRLGEHNFYGGK